MEHAFRSAVNLTLVCAGLLAAGACSDNFDVDLRDSATGLDTSNAARQAASGHPQADGRTVIARHAETVTDLANRLGIDPEELARHNGLSQDRRLNEGEIIALPESANVENGTGPLTEEVDITTLATNALDRVEAESGIDRAPGAQMEPSNGTAPIRHQVVRGETAYSIARIYDVSVRSLADWNGLGPEMSVREGQYLIIPVTSASVDPSESEPTAPGDGSPTPVPPSASKPLPEERPAPVPVARDQPEPSPSSEGGPASGNPRLTMPVDGRIVRAYEKGANEGIDIAAEAGTPVAAADDGTVAVITADTDLGTILVLRHTDNLLTVYANVDGLRVQKGDPVSRGQTIGEIGDEAGFLHFEVREGIESADPMAYLN